MANKLKDLKVKKVDFVDAGANPDAHIRLFKRDGSKGDDAPEDEKLADKIAGAISKKFCQMFKKASEAETFSQVEEKAGLERIWEEIWEVCRFFSCSLESIIRDPEVEAEQKTTLLSKSLMEFTATVQAAIGQWAYGNTTKLEKSATPPELLELLREDRDRLDALLKSTEPPPGNQEGSRKSSGPNGATIMKGETEDMKFDTNKLTTEEQATLAELEKKAGIPEDKDPEGTDPVAKSVEGAGTEDPAPTETDDDIYKGMTPAAAQEMKVLRKFREDTEEKALAEIAKKYELIGKKPEELVPMLKSLKAAGGTAYDDCIAVLDSALESVEKSGLYAEVGKSGGGGTDEPWAVIEKKAVELQKADPNLSRVDAIDKACSQNPELLAEYEEKR